MPSDGSPRRWEWPPQFMREVDKLGLSKDEAARLVKVMGRFAAGRAMPSDHKSLRDGVEELRVNGDRRIFRIYFTQVQDGLVLLCLHAQSKKKNNDRNAVELAISRRRAHLDGQWP